MGMDMCVTSHLWMTTRADARPMKRFGDIGHEIGLQVPLLKFRFAKMEQRLMEVRTRVVERFRRNNDYNKLQRTNPELPLLTQARADAAIRSIVCFPEPSKAKTQQALKRLREELPQLAHSNDTMDQEQLRRLSSHLSTLTASIKLQERSIEEDQSTPFERTSEHPRTPILPLQAAQDVQTVLNLVQEESWENTIEKVFARPHVAEGAWEFSGPRFSDYAIPAAETANIHTTKFLVYVVVTDVDRKFGAEHILGSKEADDDPLRYFVHFMSKDVADSDLSDMTWGVLLDRGLNGPSRYRSGTGAEPIVDPNKYEKVMLEDNERAWQQTRERVEKYHSGTLDPEDRLWEIVKRLAPVPKACHIQRSRNRQCMPKTRMR
ncbi:hypothetical protein B0A55_12833 [Friedmanniomyces simplex]|uniref:Uncharacterized protein n=1 Tax=Friedmanniomyces simplex TaxID=329884 RepID=A0A4U0W6T6_9PEZI|nr:hypothetical protein B0A55_12833 [Friedmanniomyces simplex]